MAYDDDLAVLTAERPTEEEIRAVNYGLDGKGDIQKVLGPDRGIQLTVGGVATIQFEIQKALDFLQACETSHPRVTYGYGRKIKPGQVPGRDFASVDCSGFVRELVRRATDLGTSFPDGSVIQHEWVEAKRFGADTVAAAKKADGAVRIAFLPPSPRIGHVVLIYNGKTLESHSVVGPDSRPWDGSGWQAKTAAYLLSPAGE